MILPDFSVIRRLSLSTKVIPHGSESFFDTSISLNFSSEKVEVVKNKIDKNNIKFFILSKEYFK